VILGTGAGSGIAIEGRPLVGRHRIAGEWGHNPLPWPRDDEWPGPECYCGRHGCLQTFVSGTGIAADHRRRTGQALKPEAIVGTYRSHAVDFDGDGRRDMWGSAPDALAWTANYLKASGWRSGESWGYEVAVPPGFDYALADDTTERPLSEWMQFGVQPASGGASPNSTEQAVLTLPAGARGPAFLLLPNFRVLLRYNNSTAYALSVGHLADRLRGAGAFAQPWPRGNRALTMSERRELQMLLGARGFAVGEPDGRLGPKTRAAV
jgi:hypothetical protein